MTLKPIERSATKHTQDPDLPPRNKMGRFTKDYRKGENFKNVRDENRRNVTMDTSVLVSYVLSKDHSNLGSRAVLKSIAEDRLMLTDVIREETIGYSNKRKVKLTGDYIEKKLSELGIETILIQPIPSSEELRKRYDNRDLNDLKVIYSADVTDSVILVAYDKDFRSGIGGMEINVMYPHEYLNEDRSAEIRK